MDGRLVAEAGGECLDAGVDVVADDSHALDAVDAAQGGFVGVPALDAGVGVLRLVRWAWLPTMTTRSASSIIWSVSWVG